MRLSIGSAAGPRWYAEMLPARRGAGGPARKRDLAFIAADGPWQCFEEGIAHDIVGVIDKYGPFDAI